MNKAVIAILAAMLLPGRTMTQVATPAPLDSRLVNLVVLDGAIGPATSGYVTRALQTSVREHSPAMILQLDTPGGLDTSMREIIKAILASPIPVVGYVAPGGARAASAGTYILYACHLAAMAPATNLGAATPVSVGGEDNPGKPDEAGKPDNANKPDAANKSDKGAKPDTVGKPTKGADQASPAGSTMERKMVNDAVAYIRSLAALRGRNADWAENAVRSAASLSANEALQQHVVDLIAADVPDLLRQLDGKTVTTAGGVITLHTRALAWKRIEPDWRIQLLSALTHPTIAYGLLLIGIYGLLLEGYNPGAILPGVAGATSLLFALYAFQLLSVNYAGLALIALGVGLMVTELFVSAFGSLVIGGLIAFVIGSLLLFDSSVPGLQVARPLIIGLASAGALLALGIVLLGVRARRRPVSTGAEAMVGAIAQAVADMTLTGQVRYGGELWNARTLRPMHAGQSARIIKVEGLVLWVDPMNNGTAVPQQVQELLP